MTLFPNLSLAILGNNRSPVTVMLVAPKREAKMSANRRLRPTPVVVGRIFFLPCDAKEHVLDDECHLSAKYKRNLYFLLQPQ